MAKHCTRMDKHVLAAHQAAVEQRQPRQGHEQHQAGGGQEPTRYPHRSALVSPRQPPLFVFFAPKGRLCRSHATPVRIQGAVHAEARDRAARRATACGSCARTWSPALTVAIVALPLSMAIAIASGVGPERGLYAAIVGGFLISLLGGSRFQIGGPAGAFIVLVAAPWRCTASTACCWPR